VAVHFSAAAMAAAVVAVIVGAAAQVVSGFGFSLLAAPVFVQLVGAARAVRMANLLALGVNLLVLWRDARSARPGYALRLLAPALVVTPLVAYGVHRTNPGVLSVVVGAVIVASALLLRSGRRWARLRGSGGMLVAGAVSAAMNTASGVGGPSVAMYALNADWPVDLTRPTLQLYFLGLNFLSFLALGGVSLAGRDLAGLLGGIAFGFGLGTVIARRLSAAGVARAILLLSLLGGLAAIGRGLTQI
jgi:uncharacterized membrane protein YfcA